MTRRFKRILISTGVMLSSVFHFAASAQTLIAASRGPSSGQYRVGTVLQRGLTLNLKAGDQLTVVDQKGTRVLSGPGHYTLGEDRLAPSLRQDLRTIVSSTESTVRRQAALRSIENGGTAAAPDPAPVQPTGRGPESLWQIDPSLPGDWCTVQDADLELWRADHREGTDVIVTGENGDPVSSRWRKGESSILWPNRVVPTQGGRYSIQYGPGASNYIVLHVIAAPANDMLGLARQLSEQNCLYQLQYLERRTQ